MQIREALPIEMSVAAQSRMAFLDSELERIHGEHGAQYLLIEGFGSNSEQNGISIFVRSKWSNGLADITLGILANASKCGYQPGGMFLIGDSDPMITNSLTETDKAAGVVFTVGVFLFNPDSPVDRSILGWWYGIHASAAYNLVQNALEVQAD